MAKQITSLGLILLRKVKDVQVVRAPRLRLSSEDNSTLTGTAAILEQFGKDFSIPCLHNYDAPFNKNDKKFDINSARMQYEFVKSVELHRTEMLESEKQMRSYEKKVRCSRCR